LQLSFRFQILNLEGGGGGAEGRGRKSKTATSIDVSGVEQSKMQYDSTGMYHWCPSRDLESCLMDRQEAAMTVLQVGLEKNRLLLTPKVP
jgi:hypothetical protein